MKKWLVLVLCLGMSGCAGKLAYNNADFLINWYLSEYIEFTDKQKPLVKDTIAAWLAWHRSHEMPKYRDQLQRLKRDINNNTINRNTLTQHTQEFEGHWQRLREHVVQDVVTVAMTLDISQMSRMFVTMANEREENYQDFKKRTRKRPKLADRIVERMEVTLGYVTPEQTVIVEQYAPQLQPTYAKWMAHSENMQSQVRRVLISKDFIDDAPAQLSTLILESDSFRPADYQRAREVNQQLYIAMFSDIFPTLETRQKQRLLDEIDEYAQLLEDIIEG